MGEAKRMAVEIVTKQQSTNPKEIADQRGITVIYEDLGSVWGYFHYFKRIPVIHINNRLDPFRSRFTLAHELGHFILHPRLNTPFLKASTLFSVDRIEREANRFALYVLIGSESPQQDETKFSFLSRCGIPEEYHIFY